MENAGAVGQTRATRGISATTTKNGACRCTTTAGCLKCILEGFQAGLSWECVLNKQEAFRRAFDDFDWDKVAAYDETRQAALYADPGIIRNRRKIAAAVGNAAAFAAIRQEFGSFDSYLWQWTGGKTLVECGPTTSPLSDAISKDLKKRGMKFVGSTIIYAYLQAVGVLYAHEPGCFLEAAP